MSPRPHLVENLTEETRHGAALAYLAGDPGTSGHPVAVATGYLNLAGLHHLAATIADGRGIRLLLGVAPDPALGGELPMPRLDLALNALARERDLARFPPSRAAGQLRAIAAWLDDRTVEVRRFVDQFLHGKAYLFGTTADPRAALVTSANLTRGGLFSNLELGLVDYDPHVAGLALQWFDGLWAGAVDFREELRSLLFPDPGLVDPQMVYLRALLELYGDELEDGREAEVSAVSLAPFQRDGFQRALGIVDRHHGVVFADGVGTGKTEVGLAFIEEYAVRRGHHALVVTPAQLVDTWRSRIDRALLPAQVVSYQEFATDEQLAPHHRPRRRRLHNARDSYRLVVVDEGHAFRNPDTTWYRALDRLMGGERKDLVLLTATPINNGLWDLYHMVMAFARHDRAFSTMGITAIRDLFVRAGANDRDPENLDPDVLFPLADAVSVRRDRQFIEENYPGATFPDGTPVRFPTPHLRTERYDLDLAYPGVFVEITTLIESLKMARYLPSTYETGGEGPDAAEAQLGGLLQSGLLKRFESCWWSCLRTVDRMVVAHDAFLAAWDAGSVPSGEAVRQAVADLDDGGVAAAILELLETDAGARPVAEFRPEYRDAVASDRALLSDIQGRLSALNPKDDPKLRLLRRLLGESVSGLAHVAPLPSQKVAVFSTFADTIRYLDEQLPGAVQHRRRVAVIGPETDPDTRTGLLARFCPHTVVSPDYAPPDGEVDLLLSTDVLSEGQNLQQASGVISYDMPWNPQRVVQRNGRVIRLKSPHSDVYLVTLLPEPGDLEPLLHLEARIQAKLVAASLYGPTEVIEGIESQLRSYADRLASGDESLLEEEGPRAFGFSGEALRAQVMRAFAEGEVGRLRRLPWGIGAAFRQGPDALSIGAPGVFFACRTRTGERYWRYVEQGDDGPVVVTEMATILRRIDPGRAAGMDAPGASIDLEGAWREAVTSIIGEHNRPSGSPGSSPQIGPLQRFALGVLRDPLVPLPPGAANAEAALSVERSSAVRQALGVVRGELASGLLSRPEAAARIIEVVEIFGLRPVDPPPPLEAISEDDIGVVCWMAVLAQGEVG